MDLVLGIESTRRGRRFVQAALLLASLVACDERRKPTGGGYVGGKAKASSNETQRSEPKDEESKEDSAPEQAAPPKTPAAGPTSTPPPKYTEITTRWGLSELHDLGPAGPATATPEGVYFVTRSDELVLAKRKKNDEFVALSAERTMFAKYGRGPSVSRTHAYWVSERGLLLRAPVRGGKPEILFDQARLGTRTSVVTVAGRDVVTFIAEIKDKPYAYVWASKGKGSQPETLRLTPEGATATSVALVEGKPHPRAIVLAGRLGMSPVHVRRIRTTSKRLMLEADEVVWVGPGSHVLTEIHALRTRDDHAVAFLPTAKDFNDFGLAQLDIGTDPGEIDSPSWHIYPNGLDPAPVATGRFCGKNYVVFAKPTEARPRSPQELHLVEIKSGPPGEGEVIARSRAFADLSLASITTGALATWTADHRTWAMELSCPKSKPEKAKK